MTYRVTEMSSTPNGPPQNQSIGHTHDQADHDDAVSPVVSETDLQHGRESHTTALDSNTLNARSDCSPSSGYAFGKGDSGYTKVAQLDFEPQPSHTSLWTVGLMTPASIVCFFLLATLIAIAHYLYCLHLDKKFVENTIPQSWNAALSIAFARAFSTALAASASTAFTQLLWWYLRRKALSLSNIDALFSISTSPLRLHELGLLGTTPLLWFFGLLLPLISIVTIFPPGSLVIQQLPDERPDIPWTVPTLNVDDRGDRSAAAFWSHAMFDSDTDAGYLGPSLQYSRIAQQTLMIGAYLTRDSPCGANCSYDLTISAPAFRCEDIVSPQLSDSASYQAGDNKTTNRFDIYHVIHNRVEDDPLTGGDDEFRNISCATLDTIYTAHVSYVNHIQTVTLEVLQEKPLDQSSRMTSSLFYPVTMSTPSETGLQLRPEDGLTIDELYQYYHDIQLVSIRDALTVPMTGSIGRDSANNYKEKMGWNISSGNLLPGTPFAEVIYQNGSGWEGHWGGTTNKYKRLYFRLSASLVEHLMQNVTISLLNTAMSNTSTQVTTTLWKPAYVFKNPVRLVAAYAGILSVCLAFVLLGLRALWQNGTPAFTGGFLQIMCTTTHSESIMNEIAREAGISGTIGLPKDLLDLRVRYGSVPRSGNAQRYTAFGTVEETEELLKSSHSSDVAKA